MSIAEQAPLRTFAPRRSPRCPLAVPVRVTVQRAGTPFSIPGRARNLCEGGISVVLAGEVAAADTVGIEFLLPEMGLGLQAKAIVRHHSSLGCGFEFQALTRHQQAVIREWSRQMLQVTPQNDTPAARVTEAVRTRSTPRKSPAKKRELGRWLWPVIGVALAMILFSWWHWQKEWRKLEERLPKATGAALRGPALPHESVSLHGRSALAKGMQDDRAADCERPHRA